MNARGSILLLTIALGACAGSPQQLPVGLSLCNAVAQPGGFAVEATVENKSDRPIANLTLALGFYHDFRYSQYTATSKLKQELDPGQKRDIAFTVNTPGVPQTGQAMRCLVTHIGYMDGTSADLPQSQ